MTFDPKAFIAEQVAAIQTSVPGNAIIGAGAAIGLFLLAIMKS